MKSLFPFYEFFSFFVVKILSNLSWTFFSVFDKKLFRFWLWNFLQFWSWKYLSFFDKSFSQFVTKISLNFYRHFFQFLSWISFNFFHENIFKFLQLKFLKIFLNFLNQIVICILLTKMSSMLRLNGKILFFSEIIII